MKVINKIRRLAAFLFIAVFISSLLIKPVHVLSHLHTGECISHTHTDHEKTDKHKDCYICHFTLSAFISYEFQKFYLNVNSYKVKISEKEYNTCYQAIVTHPLLRAPPVS